MDTRSSVICGFRQAATLALLAAASMAARYAPAAGLVTIDAGAHYPEGPLWRDGQLLFVEYAGSGVKIWDGSTVKDFWRGNHCGPSGLIDYRGDHLLVACYDSNSVIELDGGGRQIRRIDHDRTGHGFVGPNDFMADRRGGIYFSASGVFDLNAPISGAVLYLRAGQTAPREVANLIHYSNGLTLSANGKDLLVAEGLAGRILVFPIKPDGSLGPRRVWARLQDLAPPTANADAYNGPDGLKLGPDGFYYIAQSGSGRILVVDDQKRLVRTVEVPTPYVTNVNFGPDGAATLYITGVFDPWKAPFPGAVYRWTR